MNKAFTLVELAIVIVIIGLLVGGVLTGQELIKQAKLRSIIKEFQSYDAAVNTFKAKYNGLPGDLTNAKTIFNYTCSNITTARGDRKIEWTWINDCGAEQMEAWMHLGKSKIIKGEYPGTCSGGCNVKTYKQFPFASHSQDNYYMLYYVGNHFGNSGNMLVFSGVSGATINWSAWGAAISQADSYNLDSKADDGVASTGKLLAAKGRYDSQGTYIETTNICITNTGQYIDIASENRECMLFYKID